MTTTQKWQMLVLTAAVFYGSGLVAMDTLEKQQQRSPLSNSNGLRRSNPIEILAMSCSAESRKKQQMAQEGNPTPNADFKHIYYVYPGSGSPVESWDGKVSVGDAAKPMSYHLYWQH
jgi:hypothetical protein